MADAIDDDADVSLAAGVAWLRAHPDGRRSVLSTLIQISGTPVYIRS